MDIKNTVYKSLKPVKVGLISLAIASAAAGSVIEFITPYDSKSTPLANESIDLERDLMRHNAFYVTSDSSRQQEFLAKRSRYDEIQKMPEYIAEKTLIDDATSKKMNTQAAMFGGIFLFSGLAYGAHKGREALEEKIVK